MYVASHRHTSTHKHKHKHTHRPGSSNKRSSFMSPPAVSSCRSRSICNTQGQTHSHTKEQTHVHTATPFSGCFLSHFSRCRPAPAVCESCPRLCLLSSPN